MQGKVEVSRIYVSLKQKLKTRIDSLFSKEQK